MRRPVSSPWKIAWTSIIGAPIIAFFYLPWNIFTSWPVVIAWFIVLATAIALFTVWDEHGPAPDPAFTRWKRKLLGRGRPVKDRSEDRP